MKKRGKLVLMLLMLTLFVSCNTKKVPLDDTSWNLVELNGTIFNREDSSAYTINFSKEEEGVKVYGKGDFNRYFGKAVIDVENRTIAIENIASTRAMSLNQAREDKFIKTISSVKTYYIKKNELYFLDGKTVIAKFANSKTK